MFGRTNDKKIVVYKNEEKSDFKKLFNKRKSTKKNDCLSSDSFGFEVKNKQTTVNSLEEGERKCLCILINKLSTCNSKVCFTLKIFSHFLPIFPKTMYFCHF